MTSRVVHNSTRRRFEMVVDGALCVLEYHFADGVMTITHTGVPPALEGRGLASELTLAAFSEARDNGWRIVPACAYSAAWIRRHPEFDDLLA